MEKEEKQLSKLLSYVLRHNPAQIGIVLNEEGWTAVDTLLHQLQAHGYTISFALLQQIVQNNSKQRFSFNDDNSYIRANQGHSVAINAHWPQATPPSLLYHGTGSQYVDAIMQEGLQKRSRHHVHLSDNQLTALEIGRRHGKPVLLTIDTAAMLKDGCIFFITENNVWLTEEVKPQYLSLPL
jgi:putative RNA 2'-phosphotransferase